MKRNLNNNVVETSGTMQTSQFSIDLSAEMFELISKGLYSRPIEAIVRELMCNGFDSQTENGNPEKPMTVKAPTYLDPTFYVRDYGTGMSPTDIHDLYTVVFKSDKTQTDDLTGCFGVGSKSPFAYTNQFNVESFFEGKKYVYSVFKDQKGIPSIGTMVDGVPSDEPSGVKVSFTVASADQSKFHTEIKRVASVFSVTPEVIGGVEVEKVKYIHEEPGSWGAKSGNFRHGFHAIMGNVSYGIEYPKVLQHLEQDPYNLNLNTNSSFFNRSLFSVDLYFEIGELTPAASREYLQYDEKTLKALCERILNITKSTTDSINNAVKHLEYKEDVVKLLRNSDINPQHPWAGISFSAARWKGSPLPTRRNYSLSFLNKITNGPSQLITCYHVDYFDHSKKIRSRSIDYYCSVDAGNENIFILADTPHKCVAKTKWFLKSKINNSKKDTVHPDVYLIRTYALDETNQEIIQDFLNDEYGVNPKNVLLVSELDSPPTKSKASSNTPPAGTFKTLDARNTYNLQLKSVDPLELEEDAYYVFSYFNQWGLSEKQTHRNLSDLKEIVDLLNLDKPLYAILKTKEDEVPESWTPLSSVLEKLVEWASQTPEHFLTSNFIYRNGILSNLMSRYTFRDKDITEFLTIMENNNFRISQKLEFIRGLLGLDNKPSMLESSLDDKVTNILTKYEPFRLGSYYHTTDSIKIMDEYLHLKYKS